MSTGTFATTVPHLPLLADVDFRNVQLGSRLQHMVATASSVLFDPDKSSGALQKQASVLNRALQLGQAKSLRELMHKLRWAGMRPFMHFTAGCKQHRASALDNHARKLWLSRKLRDLQMTR